MVSQTVDLLSGSLEYSFSASGVRPLRDQGLRCSEASGRGKVRLEDLESAFDTPTFQSHSEATSSRKSQDGKPYDCTVSVDAAVDASFALLGEINDVLATYPDQSPVLEPLTKILIMPSRADDHQSMVTAMRTLETGLIGFHHISQYLPERTVQTYLLNVIAKAEILRRHAGDLVRCENESSFFDLKASKPRPSCKAVQTLYDVYFGQIKFKIEARIAAAGDSESMTTNKPLLQTTLSSLQFQIAGAYLTHQGTQELTEQLEHLDSSEDIASLANMMRLAIGAGDVLQACQENVQKSAVRMAVRKESVSDFEQLIYSHLALTTRGKDPSIRIGMGQDSTNTLAAMYAGCQPLLEDAIRSTRAAEENLRTWWDQPTTGAKIVQMTLLQYVERIQDHLKKPFEDRADVELRQLEMVVAILVKMIKDVLSSSAYSVMKTSLGPLQQLEFKVHRLYSCVLSGFPSTSSFASRDPEGSKGFIDSDALTARSRSSLQCDLLAGAYRGSLAYVLKKIGFVSRKKHADKVVLARLQSSIQGLAEAAALWDEDGDAVVKSKAVESLQISLQEILRKSQSTRFRILQELSEYVPFMFAQANSLQACSNVWRATRGMETDRYDGKDDMDDRDFDKELKEEGPAAAVG
ncbi:hypothetical protein BGZ54_006501 [Gamsiella multidivaricata]|nr:hypothetical protein BGZ54_006501 [Gamsiella multidivaricata]